MKASAIFGSMSSKAFRMWGWKNIKQAALIDAATAEYMDGPRDEVSCTRMCYESQAEAVYVRRARLFLKIRTEIC